MKFVKGDSVILSRVKCSEFQGRRATVRHKSGRDGCMTVVLDDGRIYRPLPENVDLHDRGAEPYRGGRANCYLMDEIE